MAHRRGLSNKRKTEQGELSIVLSGIDWSSVGSIATAVAVLVAAWQLHQGTVQARTNFEDDLSREYREIMRSIPPNAYLDRETADSDFGSVFPALLQYIDLSNEQVFLRMNGRVTKATWLNWRDGIRSNLQRNMFRRAWDEIKSDRDQKHRVYRLHPHSTIGREAACGNQHMDMRVVKYGSRPGVISELLTLGRSCSAPR